VSIVNVLVHELVNILVFISENVYYFDLNSTAVQCKSLVIFSYFIKSMRSFPKILPSQRDKQGASLQLLSRLHGNFVTFEFFISKNVYHIDILRRECSKISIVYRFGVTSFLHCRI